MPAGAQQDHRDGRVRDHAVGDAAEEGAGDTAPAVRRHARAGREAARAQRVGRGRGAWLQAGAPVRQRAAEARALVVDRPQVIETQ